MGGGVNNKEREKMSEMNPRAFMPELRFDPRNEHYPVSIESILAHSYVEDSKGELVRPGENLRGSVHLIQDPTYFKYKDPVHETAIYYHQYVWDTEAKVHALVYIFLYRVNPGYSTCGHTMGSYHTGDVEHVTVLYHETDGPQRVYFAAHGATQGKWVEWEDVEKTKDGHPVVYVSKGSHASYPRKGRYVRAMGFANDHCRGDGKRLHPNMVELVKAEGPWTRFYIGDTPGPARQPWWSRESETSVKGWQRWLGLW